MSEQAASGGQVRLERIYLKDSSFESPGSPEVFTEQWQPEVAVDINTRAERVDGDRFEVVLTATVRTKRGSGKTAFIVEVQQAALFLVEGLAPELQQQALGTICPATIFPYLRETIDGLVVKGGFPALHLAPVNFEALYAQAVAQQNQQAGQTPDNTH